MSDANIVATPTASEALSALRESLDADILDADDGEAEAELRAAGADDAWFARTKETMANLIAKRREAWRAEAQARLAERRAAREGLSADDVEAVYKAELPDSTGGWYAVIAFVTAHNRAETEAEIVRLTSPPCEPKSETARLPEPSLDAARCGTSSVARETVASPADIVTLVDEFGGAAERLGADPCNMGRQRAKMRARSALLASLTLPSGSEGDF